MKLSDAAPELLDRLGDLSNSQLRALCETYNVEVGKRATKDELIYGICERGHLKQQQNNRMLGNLLDQDVEEDEDTILTFQDTSQPAGCVVASLALLGGGLATLATLGYQLLNYFA